MGNLLKLLSRDENKKDDYLHSVFVDFENCQPTDTEKDVWVKIQAVLKEAHHVLESLRQYTGAAGVIRDAIQFPSDEEMQQKAWSGVMPLVEQLRKYYDFSLLLENNVPLLLQTLCSVDMTSREHLEKQQALFKQFAEILDFVLKFDDLKMTNPGIQNDFSYYRRTQSRRKMVTSDAVDDDEQVPHEIANRMSLFYANATPMLKMLSDTTSTFVSQNKDLPVENTTDCLSTMANICRVMIENPEYCSRFQNIETKLFCIRVMVGVIILYDHVHPVGAFARSSGIDYAKVLHRTSGIELGHNLVDSLVVLCIILHDIYFEFDGIYNPVRLTNFKIKSSIKLLREQRDMNIHVEGLLNALRYTTKHLSDESTPKSVRQLLLD